MKNQIDTDIGGGKKKVKLKVSVQFWFLLLVSQKDFLQCHDGGERKERQRGSTRDDKKEREEDNTSENLLLARNGGFSLSRGLLCKGVKGLGWEKRRVGKVVSMAMSMPENRVPDMGKRQLMTLLLLGAIGLPTTSMLIPYIIFFTPPSSGGSSNGTVARDIVSNNVLESIVL